MENYPYPQFLYNIYDNEKYYPGGPVNIHIQSLMNIIQEYNTVISPKEGKGKLPLFCGNRERVNPIYAQVDQWKILHEIDLLCKYILVDSISPCIKFSIEYKQLK